MIEWAALLVGMKVVLIVPLPWCEALSMEWRAKGEASTCAIVQDKDYLSKKGHPNG